MTASCTLIGVLDDGAAGLGDEALQRLREAKHVIAGNRLLAMLADEITQARALRPDRATQPGADLD